MDLWLQVLDYALLLLRKSCVKWRRLFVNIGAISVVVPIECHESQEVADICKQACPVVALTHSSVLETMKDALVKCDMSNIKLIIIGQDAVHDPENNLYSFQKLVEEPRDGEAMKMDPEDIAYTMCTSGTTGPRKLAAIS